MVITTDFAAKLPASSFLQPTFIPPSSAQGQDVKSSLTKRRRFTPNTLPQIIPTIDNSTIEHHTFDSPLILQLCEQAPDQSEIEAGLLQVGMRVRKSVAEGYKHKQKKFTPRPFFNVSRLSPEVQAALINGNKNSDNELAPYSSAQNLTTATFCGVNLAFLSHYSDDSSSSQYAEQNLWNQYSTSHKRPYEADSDSDDSQDWQPHTPSLTPDAAMHLPVDYFAIENDSMTDVNAMDQVGNDTRQAFNGRRLAVPRSRNRPVQASEQSTAAFNPFSSFANQPQFHEPQESPSSAQFGHRRMVSCGMEAMDFNEAPFLARREDVEMDCS